MRTYDVFTEWNECVNAVNAFMENHRIDPYTLEEIQELSKPVPKPYRIATIELKG